MIKHFCDVCGDEIPYTIAPGTSRILYTPNLEGKEPILMFSVQCSISVNGKFEHCVLCVNCLSKKISNSWVSV